ncbi:SCP family extracellular subfamily protein [Toxoplasma gondii GAB2-2007-GAL-DOM2]|uniref:SCP family extracellular subfamily protein n=1 Tax=Toxoplasma gondii GAB2-2007-GAL-DOM2 TaxID=1130820 RepID=A0A086K5B6_TOXGO|nr:SCP family extracellular subfamily protein [Toxoplasma gondii GAB2-2007-GAL-DOM2]
MANKAVLALALLLCVASSALVQSTTVRHESALRAEAETGLQTFQHERSRDTTQSGATFEDVTDECLTLHNKFRTAGLDVSVPELVANDAARKVVLEIVKKRAEDNCSSQTHSEEARRAGLGENIFFANDASCGVGVQMWYNEVNLLKGKYPGTEWNRRGAIGHFTQMMWDSTTGLGCARTTSCPNWNQLFCVYKPAGNWIGVAPFSEAVWMSIMKRDGLSGAMSIAQVSTGALAIAVSAVFLVLVG